MLFRHPGSSPWCVSLDDMFRYRRTGTSRPLDCLEAFMSFVILSRLQLPNREYLQYTALQITLSITTLIWMCWGVWGSGSAWVCDRAGEREGIGKKNIGTHGGAGVLG